MEADRAPESARDPQAAAAISRRLSRIEGQVRALRARVDADVYCIELAGDLAAIRAALDHVGGAIVERHVRTCLAGRDQTTAHPQAQEKTDEELAGELGRIVTRLLQ